MDGCWSILAVDLVCSDFNLLQINNCLINLDRSSTAGLDQEMLNFIRKLNQRRHWQEVQAERDRTHAHIEVEAYEPIEAEKLLQWSGAVERLSVDNLKLDSSFSPSYEDSVRRLLMLAAGLYQEVPASKHYHYYLPRGLFCHALYMAQCIVGEYSPAQYRWNNNIGVAIPFEERLDTTLLHIAFALLHGSNSLLSNVNVYVVGENTISSKFEYEIYNFRYSRINLFDFCVRNGKRRKYRWEFRQDRSVVVEPTISPRLVARTLCDLGIELTAPMARALFVPGTPEFDELRESLKSAEHASICMGSRGRDDFFHHCSYDDQIELALEYIASRTTLMKRASVVDGRLFIPRAAIEQIPSNLPAYDDFIDVRETSDIGRFMASRRHCEFLEEGNEWHEYEDVEGLFLRYGDRLTARLIDRSG